MKRHALGLATIAIAVGVDRAKPNDDRTVESLFKCATCRDNPNALCGVCRAVEDDARDARTLEVSQPLPTREARSSSVVDRVMADLETRRSIGTQRYGSELQSFNGRDALRDAYEEALDLACYLRQVMMERAVVSDTELVDHLESQTNGAGWEARESVMGRGFRLHNPGPHASARSAIAAHMLEQRANALFTPNAEATECHPLHDSLDEALGCERCQAAARQARKAREGHVHIQYAEGKEGPHRHTDPSPVHP